MHVYTIMGLHGEAVALALRAGDLELAQKHADKPEDDDKLRKKLWLTIARHVIGTCAHVRTQTHARKCVQSFMHMPYPHTQTHTDTCARARAHTHTHMHMHTHARAHICRERKGRG